ncbi:MAG TPA: hypothetical protein VFC46_08565 [Humisphaera sp.]|nr:hypothetical protein [Humisphaera sp.]
MRSFHAAALLTTFIFTNANFAAVVDSYEQYVKTSKDFQPVRQDPAMLLKAFPSWTYMPWTYKWTIGYNDASGKWSAEQMIEKLHQYIAAHIANVKSSPFRAAYALDDEISWGHFVHPAMWRVTDDAAAYQKWLEEIYGGNAPRRSKWVTYNDIQPSLRSWTVAEFDASPLMDQWTFNDSYWNNLIGDLVDYVKIMRKVQFIEAYNMGSSQAIIRSFNPHNAIPAVTTHFHRSADDDIWQTWYYLAHGNRGFIGWVDGWFDGTQPAYGTSTAKAASPAASSMISLASRNPPTSAPKTSSTAESSGPKSIKTPISPGKPTSNS